MNHRSPIGTLIACAAAIGCAKAQQPRPAPEVAPLRDASLGLRSEPVWSAVLHAYATRSLRSEGDVTLDANRLTGTGEQRSRPRVVLMAHRGEGSTAFRRAWLNSVVAGGLVDAVCVAPKPEGCPESATSSFLTLDDPQWDSDTAATVQLSDEALNPAACRRHAGASMGGFSGAGVHVRRRADGWRVVEVSYGLAGSTVCGLSAAEEARMARLQREDSLLRETVSPVAGTYRVTVLFGTGDSSVLFAQTERHPMSSIRERRLSDLRRERDRPIVGYYLMTRSASTLEELQKPHGWLPQSYYAVSIAPLAHAQDSTAWHGDVDPLVDVDFLDSRAAVREEAHALYGVGEKTRADDWYFMPGTWLTYPDGRARFAWTVRRDSSLAYVVRAVRISQETSPGRSR